MALKPDRVTFGLDMSKTAPGICVWEEFATKPSPSSSSDDDQKPPPTTTTGWPIVRPATRGADEVEWDATKRRGRRVTLYGFAPTNKAFKYFKANQSLLKGVGHHVWLWHKFKTQKATCDEEKAINRIDRMVFIANRIMTLIREIRKIAPEVTPSIFIEQYAFHVDPKRSRSISTMYELGGILRATLRLEKLKFAAVGITSSKKHFSGRGSATKLLMYWRWRELDKFPNPKLWLEPPIKEGKTPPHPLEDQIDAFAVACTALHEHERVVDTKKKRTQTKSRKRPRPVPIVNEMPDEDVVPTVVWLRKTKAKKSAHATVASAAEVVE